MSGANGLLAVPALVMMVLGIVLLIRRIRRLRRLIFPAVRLRLAASASVTPIDLPQPGRYVISALIPPFTVRQSRQRA